MSLHHLYEAALPLLPGTVPLTALAAVDAYALTAGRLWTLLSGVLVLVSVVTGGIALARSTSHRGSGAGRRARRIALLTGLTGVLVGGLVIAAAEGGPGTGSGIVGGYLSVLLGLIGTGLAAGATARSRRLRHDSPQA
jgi:hypothetical protein